MKLASLMKWSNPLLVIFKYWATPHKALSIKLCADICTHYDVSNRVLAKAENKSRDEANDFTADMGDVSVSKGKVIMD